MKNVGRPRGINANLTDRKNAITTWNKTPQAIELKDQKLLEEIRTLKIKNELLLKDYYPASEVLEAVTMQNDRIRQQLASLEEKLPTLICSVTDPIKIKSIIQQEVTRVLEYLSYA
jgi:FtsZ-binding cell division protein ZapB